MTVRRVFVIWTNPLFHKSVLLLLDHPDIIWVGETSEFMTAHEEIMRLHPDTILFEKTGVDFPVGLMEILKVETQDMRIIGVSLYNNEMSLLHRQHQAVLEAGDLLRFVLG
jgi:hypothetical protein